MPGGPEKDGKTVRTTASLELSAESSLTTWQSDTLPSGFTVDSITSITCPSATDCYEGGTYTTGTTLKGFGFYSAGATAWSSYAVTATITAVTTVVCASATKCYAIASEANGPVLLSLTSVTKSGKTTTQWVTDAVPSGVTLASLDQITCASAHCLAAGTSSGTGAAAALLSLPATGTSTSTVTLTPSSTAYLSAIGCATATHCAGIGADPDGAVFVGGTDKTTTTGWTTATPSSLTGLYLAKVPVTVSNAALKTSDPLELDAPAADLTSIGPLFPLTNGYSVAAAACSGQATTDTQSATSKPGATSTTPPVTLPMGLLSVQALNPYLDPVAGATVSATLVASKCTALTPLSGTKQSSYTLEPTDALGLSAIDVMFGVYEVTVTSGSHSASAYVDVTPSFIELYTGATLATYGTLPIPTPVEVSVT